MPAVFAAIYIALYLVPGSLASTCDPPFCDSANVNVCGGGSSGWHATVEHVGECVVEGGEEGVETTQQFLDVKVIEQLYSDVEGLSVSAGDVLRLDFGTKTVVNCTDPANRQTSKCQTRCGAEEWDFSSSCCSFEEGKAYVMYADEIPSTDGGPTKDICGTDSLLTVSKTSTCERDIANSLEDPDAAEIDSVKGSCNADRGVVAASAANPVIFQWPELAILFGSAVYFLAF